MEAVGSALCGVHVTKGICCCFGLYFQAFVLSAAFFLFIHVFTYKIDLINFFVPACTLLFFCVDSDPKRNIMIGHSRMKHNFIPELPPCASEIY